MRCGVAAGFTFFSPSRSTLIQGLDVSELREKLANTDEPIEDSTPKRLSAVTGGTISEGQIQTFQPLLLPIAVSIVAGLLITLAAISKRRAFRGPERKRWLLRWSWSRRNAEPIVPVVCAR